MDIKEMWKVGGKQMPSDVSISGDFICGQNDNNRMGFVRGKYGRTRKKRASSWKQVQLNLARA